MLEWVLPLTVIIAAILDSILVWVYMKYAHPWKGILADEKENPWKDILAEEKGNKALVYMLFELQHGTDE